MSRRFRICMAKGVKKQSLLPKVPFFEAKKMALLVQNQNSKTTFLVQTFPKYCRIGFYLMKLSLLSPILANF